eukprot:CAMPEP_0201593458 /NCGR_PEP_ID=MMETSP0190_2-20130828/191055_1 /ASSEMBLY_ACC=CAM_ASM_000263 /TAXON_ID=37353 /ORGANISM="Rosalina sp." /LENGTH=418 /DNA_ID=CAMNT_0048052649 /DNA_START=67 /DNA_END=1321 /DNA_ORIENTATION=+
MLYKCLWLTTFVAFAIGNDENQHATNERRLLNNFGGYGNNNGRGNEGNDRNNGNNGNNQGYDNDRGNNRGSDRDNGNGGYNNNVGNNRDNNDGDGNNYRFGNNGFGGYSGNNYDGDSDRRIISGNRNSLNNYNYEPYRTGRGDGIGGYGGTFSLNAGEYTAGQGYTDNNINDHSYNGFNGANGANGYSGYNGGSGSNLNLYQEVVGDAPFGYSGGQIVVDIEVIIKMVTITKEEDHQGIKGMIMVEMTMITETIMVEKEDGEIIMMIIEMDMVQEEEEEEVAVDMAQNKVETTTEVVEEQEIKGHITMRLEIIMVSVQDLVDIQDMVEVIITEETMTILINQDIIQIIEEIEVAEGMDMEEVLILNQIPSQEVEVAQIVVQEEEEVQDMVNIVMVLDPVQKDHPVKLMINSNIHCSID